MKRNTQGSLKWMPTTEQLQIILPLMVIITRFRDLKSHVVEATKLVAGTNNIQLCVALFEHLHVYIAYLLMLTVSIAYGSAILLLMYVAYKKYWEKEKDDWKQIPENEFLSHLGNGAFGLAVLLFNCWMTMIYLLDIFSEPHYWRVMEELKSLWPFGSILYEMIDVFYLVWAAMVIVCAAIWVASLPYTPPRLGGDLRDGVNL